MILIALLSLVATVASQSKEKSVYVRLGNVFESICLGHTENAVSFSRQSQPGIMGPKGEPGINGSKGDAGEIDYDAVEEMISKTIRQALDSLTGNYSHLSQKVKQIENATSMNARMIEVRTDDCLLKYNDKCFWIEVRYGGITFSQGREICATRGGTPANIYSEEHFYMLMGYLSMVGRKLTEMYAWLGLTYNAQVNAAFLSNGTRAPFVKWYSGHPSSSQCCNTVLSVQADRGSKSQHGFTDKPTRSNVKGVICEK